MFDVKMPLLHFSPSLLRVCGTSLEFKLSKLESAQKHFVLGTLRNFPWNYPIHLSSYKYRCKLIDIPTLQLRRDIMCYIFNENNKWRNLCSFLKFQLILI